jgi:Domain of unknown function (DUF4287)/Domain of unknown function (DUF5655)
MSFQAYLDTIKEKTGLTPDDFEPIAREKGFLEGDIPAGPIIAWLAADYGLGRGHAMALVGTFRERQNGKLSKEEAIDKFFAGKKNVWQLAYDELMATVMHFGHDVTVQPTDSYLGIVRAGKKFAVVATTAERMDVGLKLKGEPATDRLKLAGSWNSQVTHRVKLFHGAEVDAELVGWLREAYDRCA